VRRPEGHRAVRRGIERFQLLLRRSASLRTRVAIAAALAAAAVVAMFAVVTSVFLVNNDEAQLTRRLDAIIDTSIDPNRSTAEPRAVLQTVRNADSGEVVYQRGFQLPTLPVGTSTVSVNGVDYRVRTVERTLADGDVLVSIGIRVDSILLDQTRIPFYLLIGGVAVFFAAATHYRRYTGSERPKTCRMRCPACSTGWRPRRRPPPARCRLPRISPPTRLTNCARR